MKKTKKIYMFEYNLVFMNIISIIIMVLMGILTIFLYQIGLLKETINFYLENLGDKQQEVADFSFFIFFIIMILWMVLHEFIHGTFYQIMGANKKNITYGAVFEKGIFYCRCSEFVNKATILVSVIAPFLIIGVITYIVGICINSLFLIILSIINITGCSGDLSMFIFFIKREKDIVKIYKIRIDKYVADKIAISKEKDIEFIELKDSATFCIKTSEDLSKKKFISVKLIKEIKEDDEILKIDNTKKITITKTSKIIIITFIVLLILSFIFALL